MNIFDFRQSKIYGILQQLVPYLSDQTGDVLMASVDSDLTPPLRVDASNPASLVVNVGPSIVSNAQSGRQKSLSFINNAIPTFVSGTATFPSISGGNITTSTGGSTVLTVASNNYVQVLLSMDSSGHILTTVGTPNAVQANALVPPTPANTSPFAYVTIFNNAGTIANISQSSIFQFAGSGGSGGSGSGGTKNYLSAISTSLGGTVGNTGNGNFELGTTSGWSLFNTSLTGGIPTGPITPGASSITTFNTVSSGQLAGSFSLQTASSSAWAAGHGFITDPFFIDKEDQAQVLIEKMYYQVISGLANGNFSGTSSNTFAIYLYDVTNSLWIQPVGVYGLVQGSLVGQASTNFQTSINGTQYRLAVLAVNASTGPITMYWDDFTVGPDPLVSSQGPVTFSGQNASQSVTASVTDIALTASKDTNGGWNGTQYKVPFTGDYFCSGVVVNTGGVSSLEVYVNGSFVAFGSGSFTSGASSVLAALVPNLQTGDLISFRFGANATLTSSDFGIFLVGSQGANGASSQVIGATYHCSTSQAGTSSAPFNFDTKDVDTTGNVTVGSSWRFIAPKSGTYYVGGFLLTAAVAFNTVDIYKNGSDSGQLLATFLNIGGGAVYSTGSTLIQLNAGEYIDIRPASSVSLSVGSRITIFLLQGPSSSGSSQRVAMRYTDTSGQNAGTANPFIFHTKTFDTHNAYNTTTGIYTVQVPGEYRVSSTVTTQATGSNFFNVYVKLNGSIYGNLGATSQAFTNPNVAGGSDTMMCVVGDQISIQSSGSSQAAGTSVGDNHLSIEKI